MKQTLVLLLACLSISSSVFASDDASKNPGTKVYRSQSGGAAMTDVVTPHKPAAASNSDDTAMKAMPSTKVFEQKENKASAPTKRVYLARSGGSAWPSMSKFQSNLEAVI